MLSYIELSLADSASSVLESSSVVCMHTCMCAWHQMHADVVIATCSYYCYGKCTYSLLGYASHQLRRTGYPAARLKSVYSFIQSTHHHYALSRSCSALFYKSAPISISLISCVADVIYGTVTVLHYLCRNAVDTAVRNYYNNQFWFCARLATIILAWLLTS